MCKTLAQLGCCCEVGHAYLQTMVFSKKMGAALEDVPLFGTAFNNWFPIVVLFWCGALFLNVWQAIARTILPARFQLQDSGSNEHLERGQVLIRKEQVPSYAAAAANDCIGCVDAIQLVTEITANGYMRIG